jgi:signal peptidase I
MSPTLHTDEIIFVKKFNKSMNKKDVVIFRKPNEEVLVIKRISSTSGEIVNYNGEPFMVPKGNIWVNNPLFH